MSEARVIHEKLASGPNCQSFDQIQRETTPVLMARLKELECFCLNNANPINFDGWVAGSVRCALLREISLSYVETSYVAFGAITILGLQQQALLSYKQQCELHKRVGAWRRDEPSKQQKRRDCQATSPALPPLQPETSTLTNQDFPGTNDAIKHDDAIRRVESNDLSVVGRLFGMSQRQDGEQDLWRLMSLEVERECISFDLKFNDVPSVPHTREELKALIAETDWVFLGDPATK
ncbi:hypothetical protein P691DRAFT_804391 [Macrolepiota fuliginosa MF-IS2]|uniref:Uncharacterized protein n=1 Tax=Macrolepiota fuliginosa MF-IS2 TaxID=1400762 RepID=A0A9P6BZJ1_9AGAR|nr:hypothetical protein P691DRAFT_804391 [Macrolepiota fuliginosa MF-IS2]